MIKIDENTPTSDLLSLKENTFIENAGISGTIKSMDVMVTDLYWEFTFVLANGFEIEIRKIKNVC